VSSVSDNKDISVTAIIQARMQSKRLPGKSLKNLAGKPLIAHVIERAQAMSHVSTVVVATCKGNESLVDFAQSMGAKVFVGSENNVLERYCLAAREFGGDYIVRITGDNPFTDVAYGSFAIKQAVLNEADLFSLTGLPLGTGVEIIKKTALEKAYNESMQPHQKEHVSPYIKEHPEIFKVIRKNIDRNDLASDARLTVDTEEDFEVAGIICASLYKGKPFSIEELIAYINSHKEILSINSSVEQRPMTHSEMK
jgi:spore coat polysaccharide biosynthesis protein SpsF